MQRASNAYIAIYLGIRSYVTFAKVDTVDQQVWHNREVVTFKIAR